MATSARSINAEYRDASCRNAGAALCSVGLTSGDENDPWTMLNPTQRAELLREMVERVARRGVDRALRAA